MPFPAAALALLKTIDLQSLLLTAAVRKPYGLSPATADLYADATEDALWCWELVLPQHYLPPHLHLKSAETRFLLQNRGPVLKHIHKTVCACQQPKHKTDYCHLAQQYERLEAKWAEQLEKQKQKQLKQQLKQQEDELKQKRLAEEQRLKDQHKQQKDAERQLQ